MKFHVKRKCVYHIVRDDEIVNGTNWFRPTEWFEIFFLRRSSYLFVCISVFLKIEISIWNIFSRHRWHCLRVSCCCWKRKGNFFRSGSGNNADNSSPRTLGVCTHVCARVDAAGECGSLKYVNNYCRNRHRSTNVLRIDVVYEREILYMYMRDTDWVWEILLNRRTRE